ncbi:MAG: hypothetical protein OHK0037_32830 [Elainellaceae cyanobacterium]
MAAVPLLAEVCLVGLAVGDPWLPVWLELLLVGAAGIAPVLWMQWQRPFCIFSLTPLALRPDALSDDRRRMLHLFRGTETQALAGSAAIALLILLWQLFRFAPVATEAAASLPQNRALGLLIAAVAFLLCNLFVQVPLSVIRVLLASDAAIAQLVPYTPAEVAKSFTIPGFWVKQIVPELVAAAPRVKPAVKRDSRSDPQPAPPAPPLAVDEALNESPWDESELSASEPLAPEPLAPEPPPEPTPEPLVPEPPAPEPLVPEPLIPEPPAPEPSPESPVEDSATFPVSLAEESSPDFQPDEFQLDNSQSENAQPELISELQASSEAVSDSVATLSEASADLSADLSADIAAASKDAAGEFEGAIAQTSDAIAETLEMSATEAPALNLGDDLGSGLAAGLEALNSPDFSASLSSSEALDALDSPPETDASTPAVGEPEATEAADEAIAAESDSLAETLDIGLVADLQAPPEPPDVPEPPGMDIEALVAEALEAVDVELLRELPDPLTDVSLTDEADAAPEPPERPPAEEL